MTTPIPSLTQIPPAQAPSLAPADTSAATTYTDLNGLAALKRDPTSTQSIEAVAQQVEAMFLQMMLKSMRDADMGDELDGNTVSMYQDMFDKQIALSISQHQDIGIGAMLKRQLSGRSGAVAPKGALVHPGAAAPLAAAQGIDAARGLGEQGVDAAPAIEVARADGRASAGGNAPGADAAADALARTPAEFVGKVMPAIERAAGELGVDPRGLLAQAALETGWGRRMPRTADGSPSLNLFGIKAGDDWKGARATADTIEFSHGVATQHRTAFRAYGSVAESIDDFARLLKNSPRYRDVVAAGGHLPTYIERLGQSGYATDPQYANKLNQILNSGPLQAALIPSMAKL